MLAERERIALEEQVTLSVNQEEQDLVMKENQALMMSAAEMDRERREGPSMEINRIEDIPIVGRAEMDNQEFQTSSVSNEAYMDTQAQLLVNHCIQCSSVVESYGHDRCLKAHGFKTHIDSKQ